jgi:hypothetical protein
MLRLPRTDHEVRRTFPGVAESSRLIKRNRRSGATCVRTAYGPKELRDTEVHPPARGENLDSPELALGTRTWVTFRAAHELLL